MALLKEDTFSQIEMTDTLSVKVFGVEIFI